VATPAQRTARLTTFLQDAEDFDYKKIWADYDQYIGRKSVRARKVSYVWERESRRFRSSRWM
jgi:hypothetical protein